MTQPATQTERYWAEDFEVTQADIDHLYSILLERETPLSVDEMALILVRYRISQERVLASTSGHGAGVYRPANHYQIGDEFVLTQFGGRAVKVTGVRPGNNPEYGVYEVIEVQLGKRTLEFASDLTIDHILNFDPQQSTGPEQEGRSPEEIFIEYGGEVASALLRRLEEQHDLVRLAGRWFPRSLLAEVNIGHLNVAEAVLDMMNGGPLSTPELIAQMGMMSEANSRLAEFSLNYALQSDERFDEVGPAGQVLWYLRRMEPPEVLSPPQWLAYTPLEYDRSRFPPDLEQQEREIGDEHSESATQRGVRPKSVTLLLNYPHLRSGTLPLSSQLRLMFPTAYEAPRIRFTLVDAETDEELPAWVVRTGGYVYGLDRWFASHGVPVGAYLTVRRTEDASRVNVSYARRKPRIEWVRTAIVNENRIRFENRKRSIGSEYDELIMIAVEDTAAIDRLWNYFTQNKVPLEDIVEMMCRELGPFGPQGAVHVKSLYSAVNLLRRCPPGPIFSAVVNSERFEHVGGPYWRVATQ